jgi:tetratricopeptide (TPR) repeat protein
VALLGIKCDNLGSRLHLKFYNRCPIKTSHIISRILLFNLALGISEKLLNTYCLLKDRSPYEAVEILKNNLSNIFNCQYEGFDKTASHIVTSLYCTTLGSVLASVNINQYNTVSEYILKLISLGLNTDVASSKLKLASILYCVKEIQKADLVLSEIERRYDLQIVEPVCNCNLLERKTFKQRFDELCDNHNEEVLQYTTALCVRFLPCEIHCVPKELRYEMLRSTQEDIIFRTEKDKRWMDYAVADSLPYLYFLQYKVNSHLGRHDEKQAALFKLVRAIKEEPNLGHRETALNILGKCMEQEGRAGDALQCYFMSLNVRRRNNAAKIHMRILLSVLINARR